MVLHYLSLLELIAFFEEKISLTLLRLLFLAISFSTLNKLPQTVFHETYNFSDSFLLILI